MTETPAWSVAVSPPEAKPRGGLPVLVAFAGPGRQRRVTVLFRAFMLIPHWITLCALSIAACVIAMIGWFGALFTGHLPEFAADFLAGYVRWTARVLAYWVLLTDEYPPFSLAEADYPVQVALQPGRLNRLTVLFRLILVIPAWVMATLLTYGTNTIAVLLTWLIVLASGRMPAALYQALAAVTRYTIRYYGYLLMLTAAYPRGAFGDRPDAAGPTALPGAPDALDALDDPDGPGDLDGPGSSRLVLSSGAKWLVACILALGVVTAAAYTVRMMSVVSLASRRVRTFVTAEEAIGRLNVAYAPLGKAVASFERQNSTCHGSANPLRCATATDRYLASSFTTFGAKLRAIPVPAGPAATASGQLGTATSQAVRNLQVLESAGSIGEYELLIGYPQLTQAMKRFSQDYNNLGTILTRTARNQR